MNEQPPKPTEPTPRPTPQGAKGPGRNFFDWLRGLGISRGQNRWLGGVAAGLAHRLGIDPMIVRGLLIVFCLFFGIGLFAYGVAWALLPDAEGRIQVEEVGQGRWTAGMTGATIFIFLPLMPAWRGLLFPNFGGNSWWSVWPLLWIAAIIGTVIWFFTANKNRQRPLLDQPRRQAEHNDSIQDFGTADQGYRPAEPSERAYVAPRRPYQSFTPVGAEPSAKPTPSQVAKGPGKTVVVLTLGLAILLAGALYLAEFLGLLANLDRSVTTLVWGAAAVIFGIGIVVSAIRGRNSAVLSFFAIIAVLLTTITAIIPSNGNWVLGRIGTWSPTSADQAREGFSIIAASVSIDLENLNTGGSDLTIPISVNAGTAMITVPGNVRVQVKEQMWVPSLSVNGVKNNDSNGNAVLNPDANDGTITLQVQGSVGNIKITSPNAK